MEEGLFARMLHECYADTRQERSAKERIYLSLYEHLVKRDRAESRF